MFNETLSLNGEESLILVHHVLGHGDVESTAPDAWG